MHLNFSLFTHHISILIMQMDTICILLACYINTVLCWRRWWEEVQQWWRLVNNHMLMLEELMWDGSQQQINIVSISQSCVGVPFSYFCFNKTDYILGHKLPNLLFNRSWAQIIDQSLIHFKLQLHLALILKLN